MGEGGWEGGDINIVQGEKGGRMEKGEMLFTDHL